MSPPSLLRRPTQSAPLASYSRYNSDAAVAQYCDAHYGPDKFGVANFAARLASICLENTAPNQRRRALDLGCAVGRASFELARGFDQVVGIDFSARFIDLARRLQTRGKIGYQVIEEGVLLADRAVCLASLGLAPTASRVAFHQANAQQLDERFSDNDLVLAANLIDRLPDPKQFLGSIHQLLAEDGLLAIASPYNWLEDFTPRKQWLGGVHRAGAPLTSLEGLHKGLARHFTPIGAPRDLELVIRENGRKFQHYISQLTLWRRVR
ncbi:putative 4-mercaptohistidine N1-methyltransferase [Geoalkalibacter sp.]|uniref:putative 4-mercaptohistidine N1-methyltransferase n=1 Tax=Geoalkalibacter sp. TaxID=3041440 RepID=UPI00272E01A3|nr:putative 4-mercaptohistidine N1-methyltransferase [Geoalkalibacter sp.]